MDYRFKYTNTSEKDKEENKNKIVLSDDTFALLEILTDIKNEIKRINLR